jgi:hypothetical protein
LGRIEQNERGEEDDWPMAVTEKMESEKNSHFSLIETHLSI